MFNRLMLIDRNAQAHVLTSLKYPHYSRITSEDIYVNNVKVNKKCI